MRRALVARGLLALATAALTGWKCLFSTPGGVRFIPLHGLTAQSLVIDTRTQQAFFVGRKADGAQALYMLDLRTARVHRTPRTFTKDWAHSSNTPVDGVFSLAVDQRTRRLFVAWATYDPAAGTNTGQVSTLDALTGRLLRTIPLSIPNDLALEVDADAGLVFVATDGGMAAVLDALSGKPLPLPDGMVAAVAVHRIGRLVLALQPANGDANPLYVTDSTMARTIRTIPYAGHPTGSGSTGWTAPIVDQATGHVFSEAVDGDLPGSVPTVRGTIAMIDSATGRVLHRTATASPWAGARSWYGSPLVDERACRFYVLDRDRGLLQIYDTRSGRLVRTVPVGPGNRMLSTGGVHSIFGPGDLHIDIAHGRAWLDNSLDSTVRMLDGRRGRLLLSLATTERYPPWEPGSLVIDKRNNRAFIPLPPLHPWETGATPPAAAM